MSTVNQMDTLNITQTLAALAASAAFATPAGIAASAPEVAPSATAYTSAVQSAQAAQAAKAAAAKKAAAKKAAAARTEAASRSTVRNSSVAGGTTCKASHYWEDTETASGQPFDVSAMKAAHKTLPMGTKLRVTNPANGKSVVVTINDRGPYVGGRCLDLTSGAFAKIANTSSGVVTVTYSRL